MCEEDALFVILCRLSELHRARTAYLRQKNDIKSAYFSRWRSRDLNLSFMSFDVCGVLILHRWVKVQSEVETKPWTT